MVVSDGCKMRFSHHAHDLSICCRPLLVFTGYTSDEQLEWLRTNDILDKTALNKVIGGVKMFC